MTDPRIIASSIVGTVDWETEVSGFCRCPGEAFHTSTTGKKDCRVSIDGAPTVFCFHAHCAPAVADANLRLRRALGHVQWSITLPGGRVLRNGDVLQKDGEVLAREVIQSTARANGQSSSEERVERVLLASLTILAERFKTEMFERFHWPWAQIVEDSPLQVSERDAEDQFRTWLKLWPPHCHIWIGDVYSSGKPEHRTHFRPITDWYQIGPALGNYTCGSSFKPGSYRRSNENLNGHRFLVVESDTLSRDEVGAVFFYLRRRLRYRLHCIIDTGGKSLHGWFDAPPNKLLENRLKTGLTVFGCDPKVFTYSQPVRVPGAWRDGKLQKLIWLKE
ncbi:MAG: hypothetical protein ACK4UN_00125 [Limisphaerales bacterium]